MLIDCDDWQATADNFEVPIAVLERLISQDELDRMRRTYKRKKKTIVVAPDNVPKHFRDNPENKPVRVIRAFK